MSKWPATLALAGLVVSDVLPAQIGRVTGSLHSSSGQPIGGAHILIGSLALSAISRDDGTFVIRAVPPGTYEVRTYRIGYRPAIASTIVVRPDSETRVTVVMDATAVQLSGVVVSASRHAESIIDAPAAVAKFDAVAISNELGSTTTSVLAQAPGVSLTQVGVLSSFVNGRGFNKLFNSRWLTLEDGRVAAFAETGLTIGEHTTLPKLDIADIEVLAGPASALYGASASSGLLSVRTKDPRQYPGLTTELSGGSRSYHDAQIRYARTAGRWGFKIAAQDQAARDWTDTLAYPAIAPGGTALPEAPRNVNTRVSRASGSLRYYSSDAARIELNAGASVRDGLGQTSQGRYRISGYRYENYQLVFTNPRWFAQAYSTHSNSGDTYRLNILTQARALLPNVSADSVRAIAAFPVDGRIHAVEVQNNELVGAHMRTGVAAIDNSHVTWGVQARRDRVSSPSPVYIDITTNDIRFDQLAFYAQVEMPLNNSFRLIGAARYDRHSGFTSRWSPKLGVIHKFARDQALRLTFNSAHLAPSILQTDVFALNRAARLVTLGNRDGFDIRDASGALINTISHISAETNETWELGYKAEFRHCLFADVTVSRSRFRNFMTLAGPIANPFAGSPTFAHNHRTGERIQDAAGAPLITYTFVNVGDGRFTALDAAFRYSVSDRVSVSTTTSLTRADAVRAQPTDPPETASFNTSPHRSTFAIELDNPATGLRAGVRTRYVQGYDFRSGTDWGRLPSHATIGVSASYRVRALRATLLAQMDNLASCVGGTTTPPVTGISANARATYTRDRVCGFGMRHHEILNMPAVGAMGFVGVRREW